MERDPIKRMVMDVYRSQGKRMFDFNAKIPLDEFKERLDWLHGRVTPHIIYMKYPAVQVATQTGDFKWSPQKFEDFTWHTWDEYKKKLALKHLTPDEYVAWLSSTDKH